MLPFSVGWHWICSGNLNNIMILRLTMNPDHDFCISVPFWVGQHWIIEYAGGTFIATRKKFSSQPTNNWRWVSDSPALLYFFVLRMLRNRWIYSWATISNFPNWMWASELSFPHKFQDSFFYNLPDLLFQICSNMFRRLCTQTQQKCPRKTGCS